MFELIDDFGTAIDRVPKSHTRRHILGILNAAIRAESSFLSRHADAVFQTLWNYGWWHDCPELLHHVQPGHRPEIEVDLAATPQDQRVSVLLEHWRMTGKQGRRRWLRSLRPPHLPVNLSMTMLPHEAKITSAKFSPDAEWVATVADNRLQFWKRRSGLRMTRSFALAHDNVHKIAFLPDGRRLAVGYSGGTIGVFDRDAGKETFFLTVDSGSLAEMVISPDGKYLAAAARTKTTGMEFGSSINVWNLATQSLIGDPVQLPLPIALMEFSPDSELLALVLEGIVLPDRADRIPSFYTVQMRSIQRLQDALWTRFGPGVELSGRALRFTVPKRSRHLASLSFPDETSLLLVFVFGYDRSGSGETMSFDARTGNKLSAQPFDDREKRRMETAQDDTARHSTIGGPVQLLDLSSDGRYELRRRTLTVAEVIDLDMDSTEAATKIWIGQFDSVCPILEIPGQRLVTQNGDSAFRVWDTESGQLVQSAELRTRKIERWGCSCDGLHLLVASDVPQLECWKLGQGQANGPIWSLADVALTNNGPIFLNAEHALAFRNGHAIVVDVSTGQSTAEMPSEAIQLNCAAASPDASLIAAGTADGIVFVWSVGEKRQVACLPGHGDGLKAITFSPNGTKVVSGAGDGFARIWEIAGARKVHAWPLNLEKIEWIALSADERHLVVAGNDIFPTHGDRDLVIVLDTENGARIVEYECLTDRGWIVDDAVVVLSDLGDCLAIQTSDGVLQVELSSGVVRRRFEGVGGLRDVANGEAPRLRIAIRNSDMAVLSAAGNEVAWFPRPFQAALLLRDGRTIATANKKGWLELLRLEDAN